MPEKASSFTKQINILYCKTYCFLTSVTVKKTVSRVSRYLLNFLYVLFLPWKNPVKIRKAA